MAKLAAASAEAKTEQVSSRSLKFVSTGVGLVRFMMAVWFSLWCFSPSHLTCLYFLPFSKFRNSDVNSSLAVSFRKQRLWSQASLGWAGDRCPPKCGMASGSRAFPRQDDQILKNGAQMEVMRWTWVSTWRKAVIKLPHGYKVLEWQKTKQNEAKTNKQKKPPKTPKPKKPKPKKTQNQTKHPLKPPSSLLVFFIEQCMWISAGRNVPFCFP